LTKLQVLRDVLIEKTDFRDIVLTIFVKNSPSGGLMWNQGAGHSLHPHKESLTPEILWISQKRL